MDSPGHSKCVVLVPVYGQIDPACDSELNALQRLGLDVKRVFGLADIARGRSVISSEALACGYDYLMWIDSDIVFKAKDIVTLLGHGLDIVGGIYPRKLVGGGFACRFLKGERKIHFGKAGHVIEVKYLGAGFLLTHRVVYEAIAEHLGEYVRHGSAIKIVPYFRNIIADRGATSALLGEDYSFCELARRCGFRIFADTTVMLGHVGKYVYSVDDAYSERRSFYESYELTVNQE